ncbi:unnamed protein product [Rotaria magnacalcarata]|uniref:Phytanoyl-CoA dioxygenase n=4 Tax=Rotaria magnacalcarata TaxID=392030 RepID=A0A816KST9_9BILA|nr:unnamed protein product [Rotaria magnacalcarata]CAF1924225.1 unnamed protein product [Rotaria magnacalcarata]CAF2121003.1 unnamed protein product [Rotaria magnacalcarata]CAF3954810.1 unnamed protein product [Rotaria magnacalcarata]CAF4003274.1 unnamed protein product [Rotaria magnacalcarata]
MATPLLLTDKQVQEFLINGYLILQPTSLDRNFHSSIFTEAQSIFQQDANPGNNILPRIPQLQYVFDDPVVKGALLSLLGSNYTMQPHRHAHATRPGTADQTWHKDSYFGYRKLLRHHQIRYTMVMYYPQDTTIEMGPTAIIPRSQYDVQHPEMYSHFETLENPNTTSDDHNISLVCTAGTVLLIHYDIVHRGTANITNRSHRYMFKFQFTRLEEPTQPTWNHDPTNASYDAADAGLLQPIVKHVWNWMIGRVITLQELTTDQDINTWKIQLSDHCGKIRLNAAYNLALNNEYNILIQQLYKKKAIPRFEAAYALTACRYNKEAIDELQTVLAREENNESIAYCIAFIFSEMGSAALDTLPLLIHIIEKSHSYLVKQYCCEALGTIQVNEQNYIDTIVSCLTNVLADRDQLEDLKDASHMRFTAALSLAKLGVKAIQAIPSLKEALYLDKNRYVNANALLALKRIGTDEALKIVLHYLEMSRWCAKTTAASLY